MFSDRFCTYKSGPCGAQACSAPRCSARKEGVFSAVENDPFVIKKETPYSVSFRLHFLRVLREVAKSGERDSVVDRHLAEHLAVDLDALDLQTVHPQYS